MGGNSAGVWAALAAFVRPGLVVPHLIVEDIGKIDWKKIRSQKNIDHLVIDKDNCLTIPHKDEIADQIQDAWMEVKEAGFKSVLIVSNSAGSSDDPLAIGAERLAKNIGQPVLAHPHKKPSNQCAKQIVEVLYQKVGTESINGSGNVAVVGDRITTDIVLATRINRILERKKMNARAIGILTTGILEPERIGTRMMRAMEIWMLDRLMKIGIAPGATWLTARSKTISDGQEWSEVLKGQDEHQSPQESAEEEAAEQVPLNIHDTAPQSIGERIRNLPSVAAVGIFTMSGKAFSFLGQGWHLINDGIRIGTKGQIGGTLSDVTLPRNRNDALEKLAQRPYPSSKSYNILSSPSIPSVREKVEELRRKNSLVRQSNRLYSTKSRPKTISIPQTKPRPKVHTAAYFAALIILPVSWFGGMALHDYLDLRKEMNEANEVDLHEPNGFSSSSKSNLPPVAGGLPNMQSTPSLVDARPIPNLNESTDDLARREVMLLRTERFHVARQLQDLDEKLDRIRQRKLPKHDSPDVRAAAAAEAK